MHEYVIRTEKRRAIDADGKPLFKPRHTHLEAIAWEPVTPAEKALRGRHGVRAAGIQQGDPRAKSYLGFLLILMQRLVTSSTRAIRTTLERRLEVLETRAEQLVLFPAIPEEDWQELDGQEQVDSLRLPSDACGERASRGRDAS